MGSEKASPLPENAAEPTQVLSLRLRIMPDKYPATQKTTKDSSSAAKLWLKRVK